MRDAFDDLRHIKTDDSESHILIRWVGCMIKEAKLISGARTGLKESALFGANEVGG